MSARAAGRALVLALVSAAAGTSLAACSEREGPRWIHLARGVAPRPGPDVRAAHPDDGRSLGVTTDAAGTWISTTLAREDWRPTERANVWAAASPLRPAGRPPLDAPPQRLSGDGRGFVHEVNEAGFHGARPGVFWVYDDTCKLELAEGEEPPESAELALYANARTSDGPVRRVEVRRFAGEGFALFPGERETFALDVPQESRLRFATCAEAAFRSREPVSVVFRVLLDGAPLLEHRQTAPAEGSCAWHDVELPDAGGAGEARLAFEVEGPLAYACFLAPVVGPRAPEAPFDGEERPDVVLFVADTLRADALARYGAPHALAPRLDRFAERGLVFANARSTSSWTLPATASLLTGVHPHETGAIHHETALAEDFTTLAEHFAARGYRTGATTDGALVTFRHGLAQGFEWFSGSWRDVDLRVAEAAAFLAADDGRPVFLFVQSYRAHGPYLVSDETRAAHPELFDFPERHDELFMATRGDGAVPGRVMERFELLYRGGSADLDRGFGELLAVLERHGIPQKGFLVVTSDHGEEFAEHGGTGHGTTVYDEMIRVPLLLAGPGVEPGVVDLPASLVDLAPTLAEAAGLAPDPRWAGTSLLSLDEARPTYAFQCTWNRNAPVLCVVAEGRKVLARYDAEEARVLELVAAYDLARDPAERENLLGRAAWPEALLERHTPELERRLASHAGTRPARLDPDREAELRALGYGD